MGNFKDPDACLVFIAWYIKCFQKETNKILSSYALRQYPLLLIMTLISNKRIISQSKLTICQFTHHLSICVVVCNLGAAVALTPPLWKGSPRPNPPSTSSRVPPLPPLHSPPQPFPADPSFPRIGLAVPMTVSFSAGRKKFQINI